MRDRYKAYQLDQAAARLEQEAPAWVGRRYESRLTGRGYTVVGWIDNDGVADMHVMLERDDHILMVKPVTVIERILGDRKIDRPSNATLVLVGCSQQKSNVTAA